MASARLWPEPRKVVEMGIFDLLKNTVEGVTEATVNVVKLPVAVIVAPLDDGQSIADAAKGVAEGVQKMGDASNRDNG